jgi:hypothetical protein
MGDETFCGEAASVRGGTISLKYRRWLGVIELIAAFHRPSGESGSKAVLMTIEAFSAGG